MLNFIVHSSSTTTDPRSACILARCWNGSVWGCPLGGLQGQNKGQLLQPWSRTKTSVCSLPSPPPLCIGVGSPPSPLLIVAPQRDSPHSVLWTEMASVMIATPCGFFNRRTVQLIHYVTGSTMSVWGGVRTSKPLGIGVVQHNFSLSVFVCECLLCALVPDLLHAYTHMLGEH